MGSRIMPTECVHGRIVDWGDFAPNPDRTQDGVGCEECTAAHQQVDARLVREIEDALVEALPWVDHLRCRDAAVAVAERVWAWLSEGDPS